MNVSSCLCGLTPSERFTGLWQKKHMSKNEIFRIHRHYSTMDRYPSFTYNAGTIWLIDEVYKVSLYLRLCSVQSF